MPLTVEFLDAQVVRRGEVRLEDAFCIFEVVATASAFKHAMQASVAIDFVTESQEDRASRTAASSVAATAVFSLNFLFFSQERYCCADATCGETFASHVAGRAHWREAHASADDAVQEEDDGDDSDDDNARVHGFKSCAIDLPVIRAHAQSDAASTALSSSTSRRVGTVGIVAYVEDMGELSAHGAAVATKMYVRASVD